jgi:hypothetical protein
MQQIIVIISSVCDCPNVGSCHQDSRYWVYPPERLGPNHCSHLMVVIVVSEIRHQLGFLVINILVVHEGLYKVSLKVF